MPQQLHLAISAQFIYPLKTCMGREQHIEIKHITHYIYLVV